MKAAIQRVTKASVTIENSQKRSIGGGVVILLGITVSDNPEDAKWLAKKITDLRIFRNGDSHFDRTVRDINGEMLVVSQFTLYGDCRKGRRPDFTAAAKGDMAKELYETFIEELKAVSGVRVETGEFGALMNVEIHNDGPVTLILESKKHLP